MYFVVLVCRLGLHLVSTMRVLHVAYILFDNLDFYLLPDERWR